IGILIPLWVYAHGRDDHKKRENEIAEQQSEIQQIQQEIDPAVQMKQRMEDHLEVVNEAYQARVKGIFREKCMDCHGVPEAYPWYYKVPGIRQIIDDDIREAQKHLDMSDDFPFGGHGTPLSDLKALKAAMEDDTMPPFLYWMIHPDSRLDDEETDIILLWIEQSINQLSQ
ncbi:MAG: heme-binding domain-containing protein, partial [bacterium]